MSEANSNSGNQPVRNSLQEKGLEKMEALLKQAALGIHVLFDNQAIVKSMSKAADDKDFFDFQKMKRIQEVMTELVGKASYQEKVSYLQALDEDSFDMLVRTYFHIVENTVRAASEHSH